MAGLTSGARPVGGDQRPGVAGDPGQAMRQVPGDSVARAAHSSSAISPGV